MSSEISVVRDERDAARAVPPSLVRLLLLQMMKYERKQDIEEKIRSGC
jgi:hypothetical protein